MRHYPVGEALLYVRENSGLVVAHSFRAGIEDVKSSPSGAEISDD